MGKISTPPSITTLFDLRNMTGRVNLEGVFNIANRRGWNLRILNNPSELTPKLIRQMDTEPNSGFILGDSISDPNAIEALSGTKFPIVSIGRRFRSLRNRPDAIYIAFDEPKVGEYGANYLLNSGNFASYSFINHSSKCYWSTARGRGFAAACANHGITSHTFEAIEETDFDGLPDWLKALPKPAAVMASWDDCALKVLTACRKVSIKIPENLILLGVDDDPLLCENCRPRLSSIKLNNLYNGQWAADTIDRLCRKKTAKCTFSKIWGITERESTRHISPSLQIVRAGMAYIEEHACEGISVKDVIHHLGISESLANRRFRELEHSSIGETIIHVKLTKLSKMLLSRDWPIGRIARTCGFSNPNRLSHLFKERYGISMRAYRESNGWSDLRRLHTD